MFSKSSRAFSQEAELSQLASQSNNQSHPPNFEGSFVSIEEQNHDMIDYPQDYNIPATSAFERDIPEEQQLSSRADAICEENRHITNFVQKSLKQLEKKRICLINKKANINEEQKMYIEIHERQGQESLDIQMKLEDCTEKYQNELSQRPSLLEKQKHAQLLVDVFENNITKGLAVGEETKRAQQNIRSEMKIKQINAEATRLKIDQMRSSFKEKMEQNINKAQESVKTEMNEKKSSIAEIQMLAVQSIGKTNIINDLQEKIKHDLENKEDLNKTLNEISHENKTFSNGINNLHSELNECRAVGASHVQNLKLQINTAENNNSYLEIKCKEKESHFNGLSTKQKELINLANQIKMAVENAIKDNETQLKKVEECKSQKTIVRKETDCFENNIQQYLTANVEHESLKKHVSTWEEDIKLICASLKEKQCLVNDLNNHVEVSKNALTELEEKTAQLYDESNKYVFTKNELVSREKEEKILHQQERESKMFQCTTMAQENLELVSKYNESKVNLQKLEVANITLETEKDNIESLIEKHDKEAEESRKKLLVLKEGDQFEMLSENINKKYKKLDMYEEQLSKVKPMQDELIVTKAKVNVLEQEISDLQENYVKETKLLENTFNSKALDIDRETENYTSIMTNILKAEEEATEKLKDEIKTTEKSKIKLEEELKELLNQFNILKNEEANKRNRVARMEKRLRTINKEIKVTRQDITDAITGKVQNPMAAQTSSKLTSLSSMGSVQNQNNEPPLKKMAYSKGLDFIPKIPNQVSTKKWVESVPDDEYDFSEI